MAERNQALSDQYHVPKDGAPTGVWKVAARGRGQ